MSTGFEASPPIRTMTSRERYAFSRDVKMAIKAKPANSENKMVNLALMESWRGPVDESIWRLARGCSLKTVYATRRAAKRAAIACKRVTGQRCGIYRCELCGD